MIPGQGTNMYAIQCGQNTKKEKERKKRQKKNRKQGRKEKIIWRAVQEVSLANKSTTNKEQ